MNEKEYCWKCKGRVNTIEEVREKPHKRKVWKCEICGIILAIRGID